MTESEALQKIGNEDNKSPGKSGPALVDPQARDFFWFCLQTAIERGDIEITDFAKMTSDDKNDVERDLYALRNFCINAANIINRPVGNEA